MSTPVRKIVREEPLMFELLNGWSGSNLTRHTQKPKCPHKHINLDERVRRTVGV